MYLGHAQAITIHSKLWGILTYSCLISVLLAPKSSYMEQDSGKPVNTIFVKYWKCLIMMETLNTNFYKKIVSLLVFSIHGVVEKSIFDTIRDLSFWKTLGRPTAQSSTALSLLRRIHHWPLDSPLKGPVKRKKVPCYDAIIYTYITDNCHKEECPMNWIQSCAC